MLVAVFLVATLLPVNMGALAFVAVFAFGGLVVGEEVPDEVLADFPADLFIILVGVTYLFAIAKNNGTVDWLVQAAVRLVGGRVALIPWVMFVVISILTAFGAVVPAAVAIIAPVGLSFARSARDQPGADEPADHQRRQRGRFLADQHLRRDHQRGGVAQRVARLPARAVRLVLRDQRSAQRGGLLPLRWPGAAAPAGSRPSAEVATRDESKPDDGDFDDTVLREERRRESWTRGDVPHRRRSSLAHRHRQPGRVSQKARRSESVDVLDERLTLRPQPSAHAGRHHRHRPRLVHPGLDIGVVAITAAVLLSIVSGEANKAAVAQIAWPTVLLITGIVTYVGLMQRIGTIDWLGLQVAAIGVPLLAALVICFIGAAVSAFASTTGILAALIPLAVPFLLSGQVGAVGLIIALALSSSIVDSSPFSTSGALCVANSLEEQRDLVYRRLLQWGMSMIVVAPLLTWAIFVLPGWL